MPTVTDIDVAGTLEQLQKQMAEIASRMAELEKLNLKKPVTPSAAPPVQAAAAPVITQEELLAIAAAIGAYLGVRAHIRQIRLISSNAWAQQGRVSIQASHRLQG